MSQGAKRPKDCIVCGNKVGTGEHVFPSALGGRREDKGIYCPDHNQWMGAHVSVLQRQLGLVNAMLDVQPDRGTAKPHVVESVDGHRYAIAGADVRLAPDLDAILDARTIGEAQQFKLDPALLPGLKERARQRGLDLHIIEKTAPGVEYRLTPIVLQSLQGGDDAMRAVAYLALTFVAHHWPTIARAPGLAPLKQMLRSGNTYGGADHIAATLPANDFVFPAPAIRAPAELIHPTGLGHTIIIALHAGQLLAYVSLLDLQCWTVRLGDAGGKEDDRTVVIHVDPLKRRYGDDWTTHRFDRALLDGASDPAYLGRAVLESDRMQRQISDVMRRVIDRRDRLEAAAATQEFTVASALASPARNAAIRAFVERRSQRLVNLITMFAEYGNEATRIGAMVRAAAVQATLPDPGSADGLNATARRVLDEVVTRIAETLVNVPAGYVLDAERYLGLFRDDMAQALVGAVLAQEFARQSIADEGFSK